MSVSADRLSNLLGFDPAKNVSPGNEVLQEALKEINEERAKASKVAAKELLLKAIDVRTQWAGKKREFEALDKKFEKELGKLMNKLDALSKGKSMEEAEREEKESSENKAEE